MIATLPPSQRRTTVSTLASAFQNDPALCWIIPDAARRARKLLRFFDWLHDDHLQHGMITGSANGEVAAYWRLPGKVHHHDPMTLSESWRLIRIFGFALPRADHVGKAISMHVPRSEDYLYLRYIGVRPDCQGKGWGGKAIRAGIDLANAFGVDVCLETATPENVGLYQRLGFAIVDEWDIAKGGPHFWTMVRARD
jgi:ribosomal protein S18 acetylase RimI-like enzyme